MFACVIIHVGFGENSVIIVLQIRITEISSGVTTDFETIFPYPRFYITKFVMSSQSKCNNM